MRESGVDYKSSQYLAQQLGEVPCTTDNYRRINKDSVMCEREPLDLSDGNLHVLIIPNCPEGWGVH